MSLALGKKDICMIWESHYWKRDLLKISKKLNNRQNQKKWFETSLAKVEQDIMLGFYTIRKLKEAKKLSDSIANERVLLEAFPATGKPVTYMNWHKLDELYDLSKPNGQSRHLGFICDQIIHSYVFMANFDEQSKFSGILFCSDKKRNVELYSLSLNKISNLFEKIGNDYPSRIEMVFNEKNQDFDISNR